MLDRSSVLGLLPGVAFRRVNAEGILLVLEESQFLAVSDVGARALELLDRRATVGDVLDQLLSEYDVSPEQLEADVLPFLEQLVAAHAVG